MEHCPLKAQINQEVTKTDSFPDSKRPHLPIKVQASLKNHSRLPRKAPEPSFCFDSSMFNNDPELFARKRSNPHGQADRVIKMLDQYYQHSHSPFIEEFLAIIKLVKADPAQTSRFLSDVLELRTKCSKDKNCRVAAEFAYSFFKSQHEQRRIKRCDSGSSLNLDLGKISSLRDELSSRSSMVSPFHTQGSNASLETFVSECITTKLNLEPSNPAQRVSSQLLYQQACARKVPPNQWGEFIRQELASPTIKNSRTRRLPRAKLPLSFI